MFQLIHVPKHIEWYGSIRIGSQATIERAIGEMGHKIRSQKSPFANLANLILERETIKLLLLYYPDLDPRKAAPKKAAIQPFSEVKIRKKDRKDDNILASHIQAICSWLKQPFDLTIPLKKWAKMTLPSGRTVSSLALAKQPSRVSYHFEALGAPPVFGKAIGFFQASDSKELLVLFYPLIDAKQQLYRWVGQSIL